MYTTLHALVESEIADYILVASVIRRARSGNGDW
jgi:hypothetical protein